MTRINLIPPSELMDQHLFAEWREIKMIPRSLRRSLVSRGRLGVLAIVPPYFTLNTGHICFFYDKGEYLRQRYALLTEELHVRGVNFTRSALLDPEGIYAPLGPEFNKDYLPTNHALHIIRDRIAEKIALKPSWYRYKGVPQ